MAPRYPRPNRPQPVQAGKVLVQANPLLIPTFIEIHEKPVTGQYRPAFTAEDLQFLAEIRVCP